MYMESKNIYQSDGQQKHYDYIEYEDGGNYVLYEYCKNFIARHRAYLSNKRLKQIKNKYDI